MIALRPAVGSPFLRTGLKSRPLNRAATVTERFFGCFGILAHLQSPLRIPFIHKLVYGHTLFCGLGGMGKLVCPGFVAVHG